MDQASITKSAVTYPAWRAAVILLGGILLGFAIGAAVGWIESAVNLFSGFSLVILLLAGAALAYIVVKFSRARMRFFWLLAGVLLGVALIIGYQVTQYVTFRQQLVSQINAQLKSQNVVPDPVAVNQQVDLILARTGGSPGFIGFVFVRMTENGLVGLAIYLLRIVIVIIAAAITAREAEQSRLKAAASS